VGGGSKGLLLCRELSRNAAVEQVLVTKHGASWRAGRADGITVQGVAWRSARPRRVHLRRGSRIPADIIHA